MSKESGVTSSITGSRCQCCQKSFEQTRPNYLHNYCPSCRRCEMCGSEFIVSYHKVGSNESEIRCMSCLDHRKVEVKP